MSRFMRASPIPAAIEDAALHIGRLDARVSASPLREAWQVRACVQAGVALAAVDGTPTRAADVAALMSGAMTPSVEGHGPAAIGLTWWRMGLAQVPLSERVARLVGRIPSPALAIREAQADWDMEDVIPRVARGHPIVELDDWTRREGKRVRLAAIAAMEEVRGLRAVARGIRAALLRGADPAFHERAHEMKNLIGDQAIARAQAEAADLDEAEAEAVMRKMRDRVAALELRAPSRFGAVHAVVPDILKEIGFSAERLSCLTGATKRLGMEGRLDDRAMAGFLRVLAKEARSGLALLDALETVVMRWSRHQATAADARSRLPDVLHALLILPAVDVDWMALATGLDERVAQKFVKRLADAGLIAEWAGRRTAPEGRGRSAEVRLWMAAGLDADYDRALRRRGVWVRGGGAVTSTPSELIGRAADVDLAVPMSEVFRRFDGEMADIDREFGRLVRRPVKA